jgi:hypothetical protein
MTALGFNGAACKEGQKREESKASAEDQTGVVPSQDPASSGSDGTTDEPAAEGDDSGDDEDGDGGTTGGPKKTLEDCTKDKKAWRAVVDHGKSPPTCSSDDLVDWCCTRDEALARFPSVADKLQASFDENIDKSALKLYHCSKSGSKTTFHFATIKGSKTTYKTYYIQGVDAVDTKHDSADCQVVTTKDLTVDGSGDDADAVTDAATTDDAGTATAGDTDGEGTATAGDEGEAGDDVGTTDGE